MVEKCSKLALKLNGIIEDRDAPSVVNLELCFCEFRCLPKT